MSQAALDIETGAPDHGRMREHEAWRPIDGAPGYEVSTNGRVRSWVPRNRNAHAPEVARMLKLSPCSSTGYVRVDLCPRGLARMPRLVHRLVAVAFLGDPPDGHEVRHLDGDRTNNRIENLVWGTPAENQADRIAHGTSNRGERHGNSRLSRRHVVEIWSRIQVGEPFTKIADDYPVSASAVRSIAHGKTWGWLTGALGGDR